MSTTVYMKFDRKVTGFTQNDRCTLAHVFFDAKFKKVAEKLGVPPLTDFLSDDPDSLDDYIDDPDVLESLKKKMGPATYFNPTEAAAAVSAILAQLRKKPLKVQRHGADFSQRLIDELIEVEGALRIAEKRKRKFYFTIGE